MPNLYDQQKLIGLTKNLVGVVVIILILVIGATAVAVIQPDLPSINLTSDSQTSITKESISVDVWIPPDTSSIPNNDMGKEIRYGRELISHTSKYLGPKGLVTSIANGMNCQNCHLEAGTKFFGNNYSAVASTYPKFRARSGGIESIEKRVNDCIERSLNGTALANESKEMKSMVAYIKWVGEKVPKGISPNGAGIVAVPYLAVAANPTKGKTLYQVKCSVCHGKNGEGVMKADGFEYTYPPLWGDNSYNDAAGLFRLSRLAGYIKMNMPFGLANAQPLTDEEAWHIAAFVNSQPRPTKDKSMDWPDISQKPIDHPFGPFADGFSEEQHKFGPYKPIAESMKNKSAKAK